MKFLSYAFIRGLTTLISFLPYSAIHKLGKYFGTLAYYMLPKFRKKALSNLALALSLSEEMIIKYAKMSMQNLMITCLEYAKLGKEKNIHTIVTCKNPKVAAELMQNKTSILFFCGHQSNWEVLFLEGTSRMPGVAIGRPIKNHFLYDWILSIRQRFGGKIITPQNAIKEGLRALKQGKFLGIVGDQGMPDSGFSSIFLGRKAWTSPMPAILSHRTGFPIIVAMTKRVNNRYVITYSDPIWPNQEASSEQEIPRLMNEALSIFEKSIRENPGEWLWSHNRFKQQLPGRLKKAFRYDAIAIFCPEEKGLFQEIYDNIKTFMEIYPGEFIHIFVHKDYMNYPIPERFVVTYYGSTSELFVRDYRFKLVFNFTDNTKLRKHFLSLSAFEVFSLKDLQKIANTPERTPLFHILEEAAYAR